MISGVQPKLHFDPMDNDQVLELYWKFCEQQGPASRPNNIFCREPHPSWEEKNKEPAKKKVIQVKYPPGYDTVRNNVIFIEPPVINYKHEFTLSNPLYRPPKTTVFVLPQMHSHNFNVQDKRQGNEPLNKPIVHYIGNHPQIDSNLYPSDTTMNSEVTNYKSQNQVLMGTRSPSLPITGVITKSKVMGITNPIQEINRDSQYTDRRYKTSASSQQIYSDKQKHNHIVHSTMIGKSPKLRTCMVRHYPMTIPRQKNVPATKIHYNSDTNTNEDFNPKTFSKPIDPVTHFVQSSKLQKRMLEKKTSANFEIIPAVFKGYYYYGPENSSF